MKYKNLYVIGTSHISKESVTEVSKYIGDEKPDIIALELDSKRHYAITHPRKAGFSIYAIRSVGLKGFFFSIIGAWAEKKLGEHVGMVPGAEMKMAIKLAKQGHIRLAMIDQDIEITLRRFSKALSWKEKWNLFADIFNSLVLRRREAWLDFDLNTVPDKELIRKMIGKVKERYPNIYRVLIEERNIYMANELFRLMSANMDKKILAIVGAGHEEELISLLKSKEQGISYTFSVG